MIETIPVYLVKGIAGNTIAMFYDFETANEWAIEFDGTIETRKGL